MTTTHQSSRILAWLASGKSITPLEALSEFGCFRLGARIWELKQEGHEIATEMVEVVTADGGKTRVARYTMIPGRVAA